MGRIAGRKLISVETESELVRAVARDFAGGQMERSARDRLNDGLRDDGGARSEATQKRVNAERSRLQAELKRRRQQPPKHPEVDAAIVAAVRRGESRAQVIRAAIAALRLARSDIQNTPDNRRKFLERLKKNLRKLA